MIAINSMSSNNNDDECVMYSKSNNTKMMINDKVDEVIEELFQSLLLRYQIGLETPMKGSDLSLIVLIYHFDFITNVIK